MNLLMEGYSALVHYTLPSTFDHTLILLIGMKISTISDYMEMSLSLHLRECDGDDHARERQNVNLTQTKGLPFLNLIFKFSMVLE